MAKYEANEDDRISLDRILIDLLWDSRLYYDIPLARDGHTTDYTYAHGKTARDDTRSTKCFSFLCALKYYRNSNVTHYFVLVRTVSGIQQRQHQYFHLLLVWYRYINIYNADIQSIYRYLYIRPTRRSKPFNKWGA